MRHQQQHAVADGVVVVLAADDDDNSNDWCAIWPGHVFVCANATVDKTINAMPKLTIARRRQQLLLYLWIQLLSEHSGCGNAKIGEGFKNKR